MPPNVELIVVAGPMKGERFPLATDRTTRIGRASRGVNLTMDEQANLDHAEIQPRAGAFFIVDLGSHSGTIVNGKRVGTEPTPVAVGSVIEVGQTVLRVVEVKPRSRALGLAIAVGLPVVLTAFVLLLLATRPVVYEPALVAAQPVRQRVRTSEVIPIPVEYVRDWGVDMRGTTLQRVTDFDGNGVDELWLRVASRNLVITFGDRGQWEVLGELPLDCVERTALDFPDQLCSGLVFTFRGGRYEPAGVEGVITWMRPWVLINPEEVSEGEPERFGPGLLHPYRISLVYPERVKGFLKARGIDEPVHYLLCEEAVSGVRAQVLTQSGKLETLDYGCLGGLRLTGSALDESLGSEKPQAFAFSVTGYEALVEDVTTFLSGSPEGLFLDTFGRSVVETFSGVPANRVGARVSFLGEPAKGPIVAAEETIEGLRRLARTGLAPDEPPREEASSIRSAGRAMLDPPGCSLLEAQTHLWHCTLRKWCLPGRTFLTVRQVGCGRNEVLVDVPYRGGYVRAGDEDVELAISVDAAGARGQIDVLRTRIGYRVPEPTDAP